MLGILKYMPMSIGIAVTLFKGRRRSRISSATIVSFFGIGVGVATLIGVLAVTGGFEDVLRDRILGVYPHMVVMARGEQFFNYKEVEKAIRRMPGVIGTNPSTYDEMMISSDYGSQGAIVKGVSLEGVDEVSGLRSLVQGPHTLSDIKYEEGKPMRIIIGCDLMQRIQVNFGDKVTLTTPIRGIEGRTIGPFGMAPMQESFIVTSCFSSGFYEYDSRLVIMDLLSAQKFLNRGPAVRWIEIRLSDMYATKLMKQEMLAMLEPFTIKDLATQSSRIAEFVRDFIPEARFSNIIELIRNAAKLEKAILYSDIADISFSKYRVFDWKEMNKNLFSALQMQKVVLALFFLIIVVVAAFNIVGTQMMAAKERIREVSILIALGASKSQLYLIFLIHGLILGGVGVLFGLGLGLLIVDILANLRFNLDPKIYMITELPAVIHLKEILVISVLCIFVVFMSCAFSSLRATKLNPIDGLRKVS